MFIFKNILFQHINTQASIPDDEKSNYENVIDIRSKKSTPILKISDGITDFSISRYIFIGDVDIIQSFSCIYVEYPNISISNIYFNRLNIFPNPILYCSSSNATITYLSYSNLIGKHMDFDNDRIRGETINQTDAQVYGCAYNLVRSIGTLRYITIKNCTSQSSVHYITSILHCEMQFEYCNIISCNDKFMDCDDAIVSVNCVSFQKCHFEQLFSQNYAIINLTNCIFDKIVEIPNEIGVYDCEFFKEDLNSIPVFGFDKSVLSAVEELEDSSILNILGVTTFAFILTAIVVIIAKNIFSIFYKKEDSDNKEEEDQVRDLSQYFILTMRILYYCIAVTTSIANFLSGFVLIYVAVNIFVYRQMQSGVAFAMAYTIKMNSTGAYIAIQHAFWYIAIWPLVGILIKAVYQFFIGFFDNYTDKLFGLINSIPELSKTTAERIIASANVFKAKVIEILRLVIFLVISLLLIAIAIAKLVTIKLISIDSSNEETLTIVFAVSIILVLSPIILTICQPLYLSWEILLHKFQKPEDANEVEETNKNYFWILTPELLKVYDISGIITNKDWSEFLESITVFKDGLRLKFEQVFGWLMPLFAIVYIILDIIIHVSISDERDGSIWIFFLVIRILLILFSLPFLMIVNHSSIWMTQKTTTLAMLYRIVQILFVLIIIGLQVTVYIFNYQYPSVGKYDEQNRIRQCLVNQTEDNNDSSVRSNITISEKNAYCFPIQQIPLPSVFGSVACTVLVRDDDPYYMPSNCYSFIFGEHWESIISKKPDNIKIVRYNDVVLNTANDKKYKIRVLDSNGETLPYFLMLDIFIQENLASAYDFLIPFFMFVRNWLFKGAMNLINNMLVWMLGLNEASRFMKKNLLPSVSAQYDLVVGHAIGGVFAKIAHERGDYGNATLLTINTLNTDDTTYTSHYGLEMNRIDEIKTYSSRFNYNNGGTFSDDQAALFNANIPGGQSLIPNIMETFCSAVSMCPEYYSHVGWCKCVYGKWFNKQLESSVNFTYK